MTDEHAPNERPPRPAVRPTRRPSNPNYAARRMLLSATVIAAIVVVVSVVWRQFKGDDTPTATGTVAWDAIALVNTSSGDVTLLDPDGTVVGRYDGTGRVVGVHSAGARLALVGGTSVTLLDVSAGADFAADTIELEQRARAVTRLATRRDRLVLAAGNRNGGAVHLIDGNTGETYDIAALAGLRDPLLFTGTLRTDPDGTAIAVADANSFQTVVLRGLGDDTAEPVIENYADQPMVISDRLLATTQVVGGRADVTLHPMGADPAAPVAAMIPAGGAILDGSLLAVTTDGSVIGLRVGDRQVRQLGTLTLPSGATVTRVHPAAEGTRLVVYADAYVGVLDVDGTVLYEAAFDAGAEAPEPFTPAWEWICLPVGIGTPEAAIIDLTDGTQVTRLRGIAATDASADGCTVIGTRGPQMVVAGEPGTVALGPTRDATLSPDGRLVVRQLADGTTELVPLDENLDAGTPIDISADVPSQAVTVTFVER